MFQPLSTVRAAAVGAALVVAAACGNYAGASSSLSPTAPSAVTTVSASGSSITGMLASASPAATSQPAAFRTLGTGAAVTVTVSGTGAAQSVAPGGTFTFDGVPSGPVELHFSGPGVDASATITVGENEDVHIVVNVAGPRADVNVTDRRHNEKVEIEGLIDAVDAAGLTLTVGGHAVAVTGSTVIRMGQAPLTLADLAIGQRVHVRGTPDAATGTITATEITLQDGPPAGDPAHHHEVEGLVSDLAGACPEVTFSLGTTVVNADASTLFTDGTCADLADGLTVEAKGTRQEDGSLTAAEVEIHPADGGSGDGQDED